MKFQISAIALGCIALLSGCGGGGGGSGDGAMEQSISFNFPGGQAVAIPPDVATVKLVATASSGGALTYASNTPDTCTVSGDTLTLVKAGECSVTASQAGGNGYIAASQRQLFVIPKQPQMVIFRNPGAQPLDAKPVTLAATSTVAGRTIAFSTTTPSVCSVSGTSLQKLADGICTVTATQEGDNIYAKASTVKNIPIGNAPAPTLTFLSGYKDTSNTKESGSIGTFSGSSADGWWCGTNWCGSSVSSDGSSFTYHYDIQPPSADGLGAYWGFTFLAPNLTKLADNGNTPGVQIDSQSTLKFNAAPNAEWFSTSNNAISVDLKLGHFAVKDGKACNVTLHGEVKPTAAAATTYTASLKDQFKISEACGLTGLDLWNELQDFPISQIQFGAASVNTSVATPGAAKLTYSTKLTLTGPITFQ
jgi:hypothetical protein